MIYDRGSVRSLYFSHVTRLGRGAVDRRLRAALQLISEEDRDVLRRMHVRGERPFERDAEERAADHLLTAFLRLGPAPTPLRNEPLPERSPAGGSSALATPKIGVTA